MQKLTKVSFSRRLIVSKMSTQYQLLNPSESSPFDWSSGIERTELTRPIRCVAER